MNALLQNDLSYYMVFIAGLLPYLFTGLAKFGSDLRYNNHDPRAFLEQVEGRHRRAHNTQLNSFEAFPFFAVGVLVAHQKLPANGSYLSLNIICIAFLVFRLAYGWAYIYDQASLRSIFWFIAISLASSLYF